MEVVEKTRTNLLTITDGSFDHKQTSCEPIIVDIRSVVEQLKTSKMELTHLYEKEIQERAQKQKYLKQILAKNGISSEQLHLIFGGGSEETSKSERYLLSDKLFAL